jgi:hypothetical protein
MEFVKSKVNQRVLALNAIEEAIMKGETSETYELISPQIQFMDLDDVAFKVMGLDLAEAYSIVSNAIKGDSEVEIGPYKIYAYIDMFEQLRKIKTRVVNDPESRQYVITFEASHCFQTIQILVRDKEIFVVVNMRSCNFKTHLLMDAFISYMCGVYVSDELKYQNHSLDYFVDKIHVVMNIGSLHIFKKDLPVVMVGGC